MLWFVKGIYVIAKLLYDCIVIGYAKVQVYNLK